VQEDELYYQLNHHSTESIVKTRRNPGLIREEELSYSAKRKAIEHHQTDRCHTILHHPDLSESLNPAKAIAEVERLMVLRR